MATLHETYRGLNFRTAVPELPQWITIDDVIEALEKGEQGDAELFAKYMTGVIIYDHSEKEWYIWRGNYWQKDRAKYVDLALANTLGSIYLAAASMKRAEDDERSQEISRSLIRRANALYQKKRRDTVLSDATSKEGLKTTGDNWDTNPRLLAVKNGVVDLDTGMIRPGIPEDMIRSVCSVEWDGLEATCPNFDSFLLQILGGDKEMASFMQRLLGYGISGLTVEHVLPILWGDEGRNGKSTLLEVLGEVLGHDIACSSQSDAIMNTTHGVGEGARPFMYALRGKRIVWTSESNEGQQLNTGLVKQLTGGDRLNVRTLRSSPVEFKPSHLLLMITNNKPHISAEDKAIWERVILIQFDDRFVDEPSGPRDHKRDPYLMDKLLLEAPGILAWLVRGYMYWNQKGLVKPEKVKVATEEYHDEEDTLGQFVQDCLEKEVGNNERVTEVYQVYSVWARENNQKSPLTMTTFSKRMKKRFDKDRNSEGQMIFKNVKLTRKVVSPNDKAGWERKF